MQNGFYSPLLYTHSYCNPFFPQALISPTETDELSQNMAFNMIERMSLWQSNVGNGQVETCLGPKVMTNVILKKNEEFHEKTDTEGESKSGSPKSKRKIPCVQKENRNVSSNLLRIFFKNILEVGTFEPLISSTI